MKPVIVFLFSLECFINCISIHSPWNLSMSGTWLFSNHVDIEVVTTLLLQSVVIILSAVCALKSALPCYEIVQHSDDVTSWQNGKAPRGGCCCMLEMYVTQHQILTWVSWMHEPNASLSLNVFSFTRFLCNSVAAEFGQIPRSDRRNSTQRCKNQINKNSNNQKTPTHQQMQRSMITKSNN